MNVTEVLFAERARVKRVRNCCFKKRIMIKKGPKRIRACPKQL